MKQVLLCLLFLLFTIPSFSQISISTPKTIGLIENGSSEDMKLSISENQIIINFKGVNSENTWKQKTIRFNGTESDVNNLYEIFTSMFDKKNKSENIVELNLGDQMVTLEKKKVLGMSYLVFGNDELKTRPLNKNQINSLFGKNKD